MKKRLLMALLCSAALLTFVGCQSSEGAYQPQNTTKFNYEDSSKLVLMDSRVQHSVTSPGLQETLLPDGRMEVVANLRNRESRRIQVQVQCEFKDAQGFPVDSTPWVNVFLTENAQEGVKFVSMNDKAKRYTVRVREAH
jgi:uncharacterized protein YcfL